MSKKLELFMKEIKEKRDLQHIAKELKKRITVTYIEDGYSGYDERYDTVENDVMNSSNGAVGNEAEAWKEAKEKCASINNDISTYAKNLYEDAKRKSVETQKISPNRYDKEAKDFTEKYREKLNITYPTTNSAFFME